MKLLIFCCVLLILHSTPFSTAKRGGGSRGGGSRSKSSSGSSWWWGGGSKKSSSSSNTNSGSSGVSRVLTPAPKLETKVNAHQQHSGFQGTNQQTNQKPIGWNVPGTNQNGGYKPNQGIHTQNHAYGTNSQPHGGAWGGQGRQSYPQQNGAAWGGQQGGAWGNQHGGAWGSQHGGAWGNQHGSAWGNQHGGSWGHNQGYSGYGGGHSPYGSYGGMQSGFGGGFGGMGGGFGGMGGGMGGYGGFSPYGMERKRGFFSGGSTFGNILTGMAIYHVTSSLVKGIFGQSHTRPYNVYNYYNQPPEAKQEIKLPSNMLSICEGNLTSVCTGATAICTTNNTVLCVVTMSQATPCEQEKAMCVNATIPCTDKSDPLCQNITEQQTQTTVNMPCYTNLTVDVNLLNESGVVKNDYQYCVTTMAVAGPDYKNCTRESVLEWFDYRSVLAGNFSFNLTVSPMMRKYQVYNHQNPTQAPSGELVLPLDVMIPCIDNATKICPPDTVVICTGFGEIMCIQPAVATSYCEDYNTTCQRSRIACQEKIEEDFLCQNKTEGELIVEEGKKFVEVDLPCFANVTINTNLPNFDIQTFNGTIPQTAPSSFMYHYRYCLITLSIPGPESDVCLISDDKS